MGWTGLRQSPQWLIKNFFSVGRNESVFPTIGRKAVVICTATRTNSTIQVLSPAVERACEWENPWAKNRRPKQVATNQNPRCSAPIQATDSVDCENSQATGAKPTNNRLISISKPATRPQSSSRPAREPLMQAKIYRLGKQITPV